jgi:hypothetical protein
MSSRCLATAAAAGWQLSTLNLAANPEDWAEHLHQRQLLSLCCSCHRLALLSSKRTPASIAINSTQPATIKLMPVPRMDGYIMSVGGHLAVAEAKPDGGKSAPAWRRLPGGRLGPRLLAVRAGLLLPCGLCIPSDRAVGVRCRANRGRQAERCEGSKDQVFHK